MATDRAATSVELAWARAETPTRSGMQLRKATRNSEPPQPTTMATAHSTVGRRAGGATYKTDEHAALRCAGGAHGPLGPEPGHHAAGQQASAEAGGEP